MKITICIPCVDKHIPLLLNLLKTMHNFTRKPDKIMIGLSPKFNNTDLIIEKNKIIELFPNLPLEIIVQTQKTNAAMHLNIMGNMVKEGFIVRADADDIIHPQKLEIIEKILNVYPDTKLILHRFHVSQERDYSMKKLTPYKIMNFDDKIHTDVKYGNKGYDLNSNSLSKKYNRSIDFLAKSNWIVNGANNYSPTVFKDVQYENKPYAEDSTFNRDVTVKYNKTIFLNEKLVDIVGSGTWRN
jgi:hypothetical protein